MRVMFWRYIGVMSEKLIEIITKDKLKHYNKGVYSGSYLGMRYFICGKTLEDETKVLSLCIWPEPYNFASTKDEFKEYFEYDFTDEGLQSLEDKLNAYYLEKQDFWKSKAGISTLTM
jgi:hypothetical protein